MNIRNISHFRKVRAKDGKIIDAKGLSAACGYSTPNAVYYIETMRKIPDYDVMEKIAEQLEISPRWLVSSPYVLTVENAMLLLDKIDKYTGGIILDKDGCVSLRSPHNAFLLELKAKRAELNKSHKITQEEFDNWLYNVSVYNRPMGSYNEKTQLEIIKKNLWAYADRHNLSDYSIGIAFGCDEFNAGSIALMYRLEDMSIKKVQINKFIKAYNIVSFDLLDDFTIENGDDLTHALLAMNEAPIGNYLVGDKGQIKFKNEELSRLITEKYSMNVEK